MNNCIMVVCPICQSKINKTDAVKVCQNCGTFYHLSCWNKTNSCVTMECVQRNNKTETVNISDNIMGEMVNVGSGESSPVGEENNMPKNDVTSKSVPKCRKKIVITVALAFVLVAIIVTCIIVAPKVFVSVDDLCAQGRYQEALVKEKDVTKKNQIIAENAIAYQSNMVLEKMDVPESFVLIDGYYYESLYENGSPKLAVVLYIKCKTANNTTTRIYAVYDWNDDTKEFVLLTAVDTLIDEDADDISSLLQVVIHNMGRETIRGAMSDGIKISKEAVSRINQMHQDGSIERIVPLWETESE